MVKRTVLGSMLGLALTLAPPALGQAARYQSDLCSGPRTTKVFSLDDLGARSTEAFRKRLWFPASQPWPLLSPRRAIFLAYRELLRAGMLDTRNVYLERLTLRSTGYYDSRFYLVSFRFDCGNRRLDGHALVLVLMNGTVILPGNVDPSPPGKALLQRFTKSWATFTDLYMDYKGIWEHAARLARDVRCTLGNCAEMEGSVYYIACKKNHEVQIDTATVSAGELWWWAEEDWPRLSPGEAIHRASAKLKPTVIDLARDDVQIDVTWGSAKVGGWYYLIGFTARSKRKICPIPANPASASTTQVYVAELAVLMDGSVLVPWPEAKPNPHLRLADR